MPCYKPLKCYISGGTYYFDQSKAQRLGAALLSSLPCGRCIGCRLLQSQKWATRCIHESSFYDCSTFATITYDQKNCPSNYSLVKSDLQKFHKLLSYHLRHRISYFSCGEYGGRFGRPHYHSCIFGFDDPAKEFMHKNNGCSIYYSPVLSTIWKKGNVILGDLNYKTAAYVARYTLKKVTGKKRDEGYYDIPHPFTGEIISREPEFMLSSKKPAIGLNWINKFWPEVYAHDACYYEGKKIQVPRYYDQQLEKIDKNLHDEIKQSRIENMKSLDKIEFSEKRLCVKETSKILKQEFFSRAVDRSTIYD
ncbi:replication initiator protein [Microviridae sp.]|nr:replication initiator protein [Microviridae sp.]